ncbi:MAG: HAMP domain-containing histidine kinase [Prevotella shahii]|jgi:sensor histidine kinase|uniref:sensor histidine kinase n=1 Tax=Hoylesella shahii TaxID=228603 RepID=UPI001CB41F11|nr:HAMP domain-containing sensor histidine kinase [Hoylesella shahii]MBF1569636.1 HAMP domain-containing histidine kinase [Hoylesella shahii]MBF1576366.1 HAMP domain-containing histidine kinase [Hoylesella shahii]MBF1591249.1 HAMP domain-containing histidine kinase [Hoylesella shahii]
MQWTDRIRQTKIILVVVATIIVVASLAVSRMLTRDLEVEERHKMEIWAEAMRTLNLADENTDLNLVLRVINDNNSIPVVVLDAKGHVQSARNVNVRGQSDADSVKKVNAMAQQLLAEGRFVRISLNDASKNEYIYVCYADSLMLQRLAIYPYVQLGIGLIFVLVALMALRTSKRAEQNKVWVGLSKETAHQLGTPISSLMAWTEVLKETHPDDDLIPEMENDIKRLQLIADRFSKIGSLPEPLPASLNEVMAHAIDYIDKRTPKRINLVTQFPNEDIILNLNASLFEWVIENLCKNAVDAIGEQPGTITLSMQKTAQKVIIEISDTGKGIRKKDIGNVFRPGFTTKKRGWGLGLSLAKRIVEEYHQGKIMVKSSEVGIGTTFLIELKA